MSTNLKSIGVVLCDNSTLKYQVAAVKQKTIRHLKNIAKVSKFMDRESMLKLVHCLVLKQKDFSNAFSYGLQNTDLQGLRMMLNAVVRIIVNIAQK